MITYEQIMYDKILAHANCVVNTDYGSEGEWDMSAIEIANYHNGENVAIECSKCNEVIIDFDRPEREVA